MTNTHKPPWKRPSPASASKGTPLTDKQKAAARQRAEEAGRRYPNLVDNMWAARQLADANGKPRLALKVSPEVEAQIISLDENGKLQRTINANDLR